MLRIARGGTIAEPPEIGQPVGPTESADVLAAQSRTLRNSIISLAIFFALVVALLIGVPGLDAAADRIAHANIPWVARAGSAWRCSRAPATWSCSSWSSAGSGAA